MPRLLWLASLVLATMSACAPLSSEGPLLKSAAVPRIADKSELFLWGTGFFIDRQGHILTAHHLVTGCARIDVIGDGRREPAMLLASSAQDDLSLLRIAEPFGAPLSLAAGELPRGGAFVAILGYAALHDRSPQIALNSMVLDQPVPRHLALISDAAPGFSGSPVVTPEGRVIGVLESKVTQSGNSYASVGPREIRLAVSGAAAREFLRAEGLTPDTGETARNAPGLRDRLMAAEVRIECHGPVQSAELGLHGP